MSGRGTRTSGCGGRGSNNKARGRRRGHNYSGAIKTGKCGLCAALGTNVFDYGHKAAANQMRTWEKLVQYYGTNYGQDICNELQNKLTVTLAQPVHTPAVLTRLTTRELMIHTGQLVRQQARLAQRTILEAAVTTAADPEAPMKIAILNNAIAEGDFQQNVEVNIEMLDSEKTQYNNERRSYRERNAQLLKHRGQAFSLILGQCTQLFQDKHDEAGYRLEHSE